MIAPLVIVDTTVLTAIFVLVGAYYAMLISVAWHDNRGPRPHGDPGDYHWLILIACRDEALVLAETLRAVPRRGEGVSVLVIDDGSTDATARIAARFRNGVRVLRRSAEEGGKGKGAALNAGYAAVRQGRAGFGPLAGWLPDVSDDRLIVTVLDGDGRIGDDALVAAAARLDEAPDVGGVQISVTIDNRDHSFLTRMQDVEFVGFCHVVQRARDRFGSLGLGGNGQFVRYQALRDLGQDPWLPCLTEDLDLGLRIVLNGWRLRFAPEAAVRQQGVTTWKALLRQRTRWAQGHMTCWRYLPALGDARRSDLSIGTRLDTSLYLMLIGMGALVGFNVVLSALAATTSLTVENAIAVAMGDHATLKLTLLSLSPAAIFVGAQMRYAKRTPTWTFPFVVLGFVAYTYVWIFAVGWAAVRLFLGHDNWVKTTRTVPVPEAA